MNKIVKFIKGEAVLCAAALAAIVSMFFVPPSADYLGYIDFHVLALLFSLMIVIAGWKKSGVFSLIESFLLSNARNERLLSALLCAVCFFTSMLITNDVALITFVPLAIMTLSRDEKTLIISVVLMTVAANLGSMLTPLGNPQNLFIYSSFNISIGDFLATMALPTVFSMLMIAAAIFSVKPVTTIFNEEKPEVSIRSALCFTVLFVICLACVLHFLDWKIMLAAVLVFVIFYDRALIKTADYSLLITFIAFFIFVGNVKQIDSISTLLSSAISGRELELGALVSQVISNVPAAVLLAGFAGDIKELL
ncbi:MAG: citrate transporter, partial [Oscillospiraceae bacterium]|nr:citrate transporter [Oscillospiraceae bacterium]